MPIRTYLVSVGLSAGLTLLCTLPFVLVVLWRSCSRRWGLVLFVGSLVILENAVAELPRVDGFQHLHWSWQAALLTTAWTLLVASLTPGVSFASIRCYVEPESGLVEAGNQLHARIVLPAAIAPFMLSLVSGWVRERTNSVWPSVFGHNLSNIVIPVGTLISRSIH